MTPNRNNTIQHPDLIDTPQELIQVVDVLQHEEVIAFDTEFVRERTFFPILEIIQVATEKQSWLIDAQAFLKNGAEGIKPLLDVFQDESILKIAHAAQNDQECLYTSFGVVASPLLDTALAAALCGHGDSVGLGNLMRSVLRVKLPKGHARTHWSVRPLPKPLIDYAHADVAHLVQLGKRILDILAEQGRDQWALAISSELCNPDMYESDPVQVTKRLFKSGRISPNEFPILLELVKWREQRVRSLNIPRRRLADDSILMDLANVRPKTMEHLLAFRGISKGELQHQGEAILAAIRRGEEGIVPTVDKRDPPTSEEAGAITLLRCYMDILAERYRVAARRLIEPAQYLRLLRLPIESSDDLVEQGILSRPAADLIGEDLIDLVKGRTAISIRDGQVTLVATEVSA